MMTEGGKEHHTISLYDHNWRQNSKLFHTTRPLFSSNIVLIIFTYLQIVKIEIWRIRTFYVGTVSNNNKTIFKYKN